MFYSKQVEILELCKLRKKALYKYQLIMIITQLTIRGSPRNKLSFVMHSFSNRLCPHESVEKNYKSLTPC